MRFTRKPYPKHGDIRYKVFFAWFPITIGLETRWLERVSVRQVFSSRAARYDVAGASYWVNVDFEQQPLRDFKYTSEPPKRSSGVVWVSSDVTPKTDEWYLVKGMYEGYVRYRFKCMGKYISESKGWILAGNDMISEFKVTDYAEINNI